MRLTSRGALDVTPPKPTAFAKVEAFVVQDVPPELDECEVCREPNCTQAQWLVCKRRLDAVAQIEGRIPGGSPTAGQPRRNEAMKAKDYEAMEARTEKLIAKANTKGIGKDALVAIIGMITIREVDRAVRKARREMLAKVVRCS